jgi:hypothetical protein
LVKLTCLHAHSIPNTPFANLNHGVEEGRSARYAQRLQHIKNQFRNYILIEDWRLVAMSPGRSPGKPGIGLLDAFKGEVQ